MADLYHLKGSNVPIEANLVSPDNAEAVAVWCGGVPVKEKDALDLDTEFTTFNAVNVPTAHGVLRAHEDWYVLRLPTGDFSVMNPAAFNEMYEPVARKPSDVRSRFII